MKIKKTMRVFVVLFLFLIPFATTHCSHDNDEAQVTLHVGLSGDSSSSEYSLLPRIQNLFLTQAYAATMPTNVLSVTVRVTIPGISVTDYPLSASSESIRLLLPAGPNREFRVLAKTPSLTRSGSVTTDLEPGESTDITITVNDVYRTKLIIPDASNYRIVQIDDINGTNWKTLTGTNIGWGTAFRPYDIDYDSRGRILIANNNSTAGYNCVVRIDDINDTSIETFPQRGAIRALAVDRKNEYVYYSNGNNTLYRASTNNTTTDVNFTLTGINTVYGLTIGDNGIVYITGMNTTGSPVVGIFNPATSTTTTYTPSNLLTNPQDLVYKAPYLYVTNHNGGNGYKILQLNATDITFNRGYGNVTASEDTSPGKFYSPYHFVAILNEEIVIIDDSQGTNLDKLVSIDDIQGNGWSTYGTTGSGTGQFNFYYFC